MSLQEEAAAQPRTMNLAGEYSQPEPMRAEVDALMGPVLLEFGTSWCGHCRAAQPLITEALALHPRVHRIKVEDGSGRKLGRSFNVKLWPTLVFLRNGKEVSRLSRPRSAAVIAAALTQIDSSGT